MYVTIKKSMILSTKMQLINVNLTANQIKNKNTVEFVFFAQ